MINTPNQNPSNDMAQATEAVKQLMAQTKMPASMLVHLGKLAEHAIHNPKEYNKFVDFAVKNKLDSKEQLQKPDYQMLGMMATMGRIAQNMAEQTQPVNPMQGL